MSEMKHSTTIFVERGNYYFGNSTIKNDGTKDTKSSAGWKADPKGAAVAVTYFDTDKNEQIGEAALFPWWDSFGLDERIREMLGLERRNFPTPEEIYKWLKEWESRNIDFCDICEGALSGYDCHICPVGIFKLNMDEVT